MAFVIELDIYPQEGIGLPDYSAPMPVGQVPKPTVGGGKPRVFPIDILQAFHFEHRLERSLDEFFNARGKANQRVSLDNYWTGDGFFCDAVSGGITSAYTRKAFDYPCLTVYTKLPVLTAGTNAFFGFENGSGAMLPIISLLQRSDTEYDFFIGAINAAIYIKIDWLLYNIPSAHDPTTSDIPYTIKVNRQSAELYISSVLIAVGLFGLQEAIPTWENNPPYALASTKTPLCKSISAFLEVTGGGLAWTLPISVNTNNFVVTDGDPLPPRQYVLYNENTSTKWAGQAIAAGTITSHPVPVWGYPTKTLLFQANGAGTLVIQAYSGGGWRTLQTVAIAANTLDIRALDMDTPIIRCTFTPTAYPTTVNVAEVLIS